MKNFWLDRKQAPTIATWDFQTALGDVIKEKYESLYVKVVEVSNLAPRWKRVEMPSGGGDFIMKDDVTNECAGWECDL